jgi:hypothetical protein
MIPRISGPNFSAALNHVVWIFVSDNLVNIQPVQAATRSLNWQENVLNLPSQNSIDIRTSHVPYECHWLEFELESSMTSRITVCFQPDSPKEYRCRTTVRTDNSILSTPTPQFHISCWRSFITSKRTSSAIAGISGHKCYKMRLVLVLNPHSNTFPCS